MPLNQSAVRKAKACLPIPGDTYVRDESYLDAYPDAVATWAEATIMRQVIAADKPGTPVWREMQTEFWPVHFFSVHGAVLRQTCKALGLPNGHRTVAQLRDQLISYFRRHAEEVSTPKYVVDFDNDLPF